MTHIILFDNEVRDHFLPFTYLRPVADLRVGILTIREKWERWFGGEVSYITQDYLTGKYPIEYGDENYVINGSVLPSEELCALLREMENRQAFLLGDELIAAKMDRRQFDRLINDDEFGDLKGYDIGDTRFLKINRLWDIYGINDQAIRDDYRLLTEGRRSQSLSARNIVIAPEQIFIEEGARVEGAILNAEEGPIYIARESQVMEGCMIRGPFALGERSQLKMGAKIYGQTTIGPGCKVGGELKESVILANSNKPHDGYLGNSVIGEWCNLGADTNCSNLRNDYGEVKVWSYLSGAFESSGQQFCGLFMGDYSRCAINTMFNTGAVVGVAANVFGAGFPPRFIPSFSWGGSQGLETFRIDRAFDAIERVLARRQREFDPSDRLILLRIFEDAAKYRTWEKDDPR
jgi:UDP-N-acetylglucosamine diphosphorylase/glucosamine-1-phosphate N-acetyltransferase